MKLTDEQQRVLNGSDGEVRQKMLRLLVQLGRLYDASELVPVKSVQVAGVSYKSISEPGLTFLEDFARKGAYVSVPTYTNPAGIDVVAWREIGFPEAFAGKQLRILRAFEAMGAALSLTCTPYLAGNTPGFGDHIAWSESSAVCFANSVLGARTNREGGPSALAAAICGVTPNYGLHQDENRYPEVIIEVDTELRNITDFGTLGYFVGKEVQHRVPYLRGVPEADTEQLKMMGAAMAASGSLSLFHVENVTPEAGLVPTEGRPVVKVSKTDLDQTRASLNRGKRDVDIIMLGCPHASIKELHMVSECLKGRRLKRPLWICTSRAVRTLAVDAGLVRGIEAAGGKVLADTCAVVAPIEEMGIHTSGVNSGKCAHYLPGLCKQDVVYRSMEELIEEQT